MFNLLIVCPTVRGHGDKAPRKEDTMAKTFKIGRSAKTGKFMRVEDARRKPDTTVVETMKKRKK